MWIGYVWLLSSLSGSEVHTHTVHTCMFVLQPESRDLNHSFHNSPHFTFPHFPPAHLSQALSERAAELCLAEVEAQLLVLNAQRVELAASAAAVREDMPINGMERGKYVRGIGWGRGGQYVREGGGGGGGDDSEKRENTGPKQFNLP